MTDHGPITEVISAVPHSDWILHTYKLESTSDAIFLVHYFFLKGVSKIFHCHTSFLMCKTYCTCSIKQQKFNKVSDFS